MSSFAQTTNHFFSRYTLANGISSLYVNDIVQDHTGYMWFATSFGLNKFDGYHFTTYEHHEKDSTSIGHSYVRSLHVDKNGGLWAGHSQGLSKYDPINDRFSNYLNGTYVRSISEDKNGNLWLATNKGVIFFNESGNHLYQHQPTNPQSLPTNKTISILVDRQNMVWVGTDGNGLCRLNPADGSVQTYAHSKNDEYSISHNNVLSLFEDKEQQIWAGTVKGLNKLNPQTGVFTRYTSEKKSIQTNVIFDICQDVSGAIWFGSYSGLNKINDSQHEFANIRSIDTDPNSLSDDQVRSLFVSKSGLLWIGSANGLNSFDFSTQAFHHVKHVPNNQASLSANFVWSIIRDSRDNVWVGTKGGGLDLLDSSFRKTKNFRHIPNQPNSLANNDVYGIYEDKLQNIWVATDGGGLNLLSPNSNSFSNFNYFIELLPLPSKFVKIVFEDDRGFFWVGTIRDGLYQYKPQTGVINNFRPIAGDSTSISHQRIYDILQDDRGRLWIATNGGLNLFDYETETFTRYTHINGQPHTLSNNSVFSITEDKPYLWLGTRGGLNLFDPQTSTFKVYDKKSGLPDNNVYVALKAGNGELWLSTNKGLCAFNPQTESVSIYSKEDGLQEDQFNSGAYFQDQSGFLYFGGVNGFNVFHPDSIKVHETPPNIVFTDFLIFNKSIAIGDSTYLSTSLNHTKSITLNYDDYIFAFEFAALNFRQPSKNQYKYRLFPFNHEWISTDYRDRKAVFTNIPHGSYQLQVKASNDDGYWNEEGISIQVIILPPWWLTWWMKSIYWALGIGLPLSFYFIRVAALKKRQRLLEAQVQERTAEVYQQNEELVNQKEEIKVQAEQLKEQNQKLLELDEFKQNMMGMIIHDLKNPLNGIIHASEVDPHNSLARLKKSGRQMLNMVLNILDLYKYDDSVMKVDTSDEALGQLLTKALEEVAFLAEAKNISIQLESSQQIYVQAEKSIIIRVFVNLLTNAIKYSPQNEAITVRFTQKKEEELAYVQVIDSGQGIPAEKAELVFQRFGQIHAKNSGNIRSTGLGLAFCKLAIESHGGQIGVESEIDQGSTFWFSLPLGKTIDTQENKPLALSNIESPTPLLSSESRELLQPYIHRLKSLMIYEISAIEAVLQDLNHEMEDVQIWKSKVHAAVFNMNEQQYLSLLEA